MMSELGPLVYMRNPSQYTAHVTTTREGAPVISVFAPGEEHVIAVDTWMIRCGREIRSMYDLIIAYPDVPTPLEETIADWLAEPGSEK